MRIPALPTEPDYCPNGHHRNSQDDNCILCDVARRDPRYYDKWAGREPESRERSSTDDREPSELRPSSQAVVRRYKLCRDHCPGRELTLILASLGITPDPKDCRCKERAMQMDEWGVEGCKQHRDEIIEWMREESQKLGWWEKTVIAVAALKTGMVLKFNPYDPAPGLVDEAIRRAEYQPTKGTPEPPWEDETVTETNYSSGRVLYKWSYGITTTPKRRDDLLLRTLSSLKAAGFDKPHLFVDGADDSASWANEFDLPVTVRYPRINPFSNWVTSLYELLLRDKDADRFALFQDDLVCVKGLREYLDHCEMVPKTYWNLYTFPKNLKLMPRDSKNIPLTGWHPTDQGGRGALGLVFSRSGVIDLLTQRHIFDRLYSSDSKTRWWRFIDGAVVDALKKEGYTELAHNPSLLQHTGDVSTIDHSRRGDGRSDVFPTYKWHVSTYADSFPGENYNVMDLVKEKKV